MSNYQCFAQFYDRLTENVEYEVRSSYISDFFISNNICNGTILDLACGTCSMSLHLLKKGYRIIGIDSSEEMLAQGSSKLLEYGDSFSLRKGDMTSFELEDKVDGCICTLDSLNHLCSIEDVKNTFINVFDSLKENGVFVFDVNTVFKHNYVLGDNSFIFDEEDFFLAWDNELLDDNEVRIILDFFVFNGDSYDRFTEEFNEKAYEINELKNILNEIGFKDVCVYDELTYDLPTDESQRVFFVAKR